MNATSDSVGRGRRVLVVEDNVRSRRLVRDLLELHGFDVVDVETAEAGLDAARRSLPALVLMDIQLPGMDGVAALRELRADPATRGIPAIAVTAFAMQGDEERVLDAGFDAYISKPIDVRSFPTRLQAVLEAGRP